jgi:hypothetical protein
MIVKLSKLLFLSLFLSSCSLLKSDLNNKLCTIIYEFSTVNSKDYCFQNKYVIIDNQSYLLIEDIKIKSKIKPFSKIFNDSIYNIDYTYSLNSRRDNFFVEIGNNNFFNSEKFPNKIFLCFKLKGNFYLKSKNTTRMSGSFTDFLRLNNNLSSNNIAVLNKIFFTRKINNIDIDKYSLENIQKKNIPFVPCDNINTNDEVSD